MGAYGRISVWGALPQFVIRTGETQPVFAQRTHIMVTILESPDRVTTFDPSVVEDLRGQIEGTVMLPGEPGYDEARTIWNGMIDKRPAVIVRPQGVADIRVAVRFAAAQGLAVSIKGGGHNVAGHAVSDGGLMLDMSSMRAVEVDPVARTARVQGGALWSDFDQETAKYGLATTGGVIASTGVAGLTLGGGIGWLVGKHGMSIDNLLSVELVTADGEVVTASVESHPDLFWALRGGGGNFGVATSFEFALHPQGDVLAGIIAWPVEKAPEVLAFYREFTETAPDEMGAYALMTTEPESGMRVVIIAVCWPDDQEEGERLIAPVRAFGEPVLEMIGRCRTSSGSGCSRPNTHMAGATTGRATCCAIWTMACLRRSWSMRPSRRTPTAVAVIERYRGAMTGRSDGDGPP